MGKQIGVNELYDWYKVTLNDVKIYAPKSGIQSNQELVKWVTNSYPGRCISLIKKKERINSFFTKITLGILRALLQKAETIIS